tara:strand:+ start:224 stop:535 length:312 start_codon:yes stop_codon:yes gene_type:complete
MSDILDTYIKKIDSYNINDRLSTIIDKLKSKRAIFIRTFMLKIELFKNKLELRKSYSELGKFISKQYNDEKVVDFTYKDDFFMLNQEIKRKQRYIKKIKKISS